MDCHWCKENMDESAIVCPSCKKDRKDIYELKVKLNIFAVIAALILFLGLVSGTWDSGLLGGFKLSLVFKTFAGWLLIAFSIASVFTYIKASKLIGTWWWN